VTGSPLTGRVVRLGDDINTDLVLPGPYLSLTDPAELGSHLLEGYDPELGQRVRRGDFLVAGRNFGCGSSREQAPVAILARGVSAVIAASFARIFLRNAVNLGLAAIESPAAWDLLQDGEQIQLDPQLGQIRRADGQTLSVAPQPAFLADIADAGGLIAWTRQRLGADD
jgi:3-isopropylmalate/(R)-2-methylmalate dehydratase small subunit